MIRCKVTLKTPVSARSPELSSDDPILYLDGWAENEGKLMPVGRTKENLVTFWLAVKLCFKQRIFQEYWS